MKLNMRINFSLTLFLLIFTTACEMNYLEYIQHVESSDGKYYYGLYSDFCIGDPGFLVLKLDKKNNPKDLKIKYSWRHGITGDDAEWMRERTVLQNYDEAGLYCNDPKLEIINGRFLVFSRGGYYFGLYDLKISKDTFNTGSPWNEWLEKSGYNDEKHDRNKEKKAYGQWIKQNLDTKIKDYIETNR